MKTKLATMAGKTSLLALEELWEAASLLSHETQSSVRPSRK